MKKKKKLNGEWVAIINIKSVFFTKLWILTLNIVRLILRPKFLFIKLSKLILHSINDYFD